MRTLLLCLLLTSIVWAETSRQEILLEHADASVVMRFLQRQYLDVQFTRHPTLNGFYIWGSRDDVVRIKAEVPNLDRKGPEDPEPPQREVIEVRFGDVREVMALLETLVPDVDYEVDEQRHTIIVEGPPGAIDQVKELLQE